MTAPELQAYLHDHIPLSAAMGVEVAEAGAARVALRAPLPPNVNHRNTAFGGSIGAVATLAAWSWLHLDLLRREIPVRLVIRSNCVDYLKPVEGDFMGICTGPSDEAYERFIQALQRHGKGRIELAATVEHGGAIAATFSGVFVAVRHDGA